MEEATKRHEKALYGDAGLIIKVTKMEQTVEHMNEHLGSLSTSYAALSKSQIETDVTEKLRIESDKLKIESENIRYQKKIDTIKTIGIVFGLSIPLTALIIEIL